jgi:hypothetical protein
MVNEQRKSVVVERGKGSVRRAAFDKRSAIDTGRRLDFRRLKMLDARSIFTSLKL